MAEHFVAHLKIEKVTKSDASNSTRIHSVAEKTSERVIEEVTQITLKGKTLETLVNKLGKHISIIEEE